MARLLFCNLCVHVCSEKHRERGRVGPNEYKNVAKDCLDSPGSPFVCGQCFWSESQSTHFDLGRWLCCEGRPDVRRGRRRFHLQFRGRSQGQSSRYFGFNQEMVSRGHLQPRPEQSAHSGIGRHAHAARLRVEAETGGSQFRSFLCFPEEFRSTLFDTSGIGSLRFSPTSEAKALALNDEFIDDPTQLVSTRKLTVAFGGGIEARFSRWLGLRFDVKDHISAVPRFGVPQTSSGPGGIFFPVDGVLHNIEVGVGIVFFLLPK